MRQRGGGLHLENRWVSRAFLVPKPGLKDKRKQFRLVVDLRPLNLHCKEFRTRYRREARAADQMAGSC